MKHCQNASRCFLSADLCSVLPEDALLSVAALLTAHDLLRFGRAAQKFRAASWHHRCWIPLCRELWRGRWGYTDSLDRDKDLSLGDAAPLALQAPPGPAWEKLPSLPSPWASRYFSTIQDGRRGRITAAELTSVTWICHHSHWDCYYRCRFYPEGVWWTEVSQLVFGGDSMRWELSGSGSGDVITILPRKNMTMHVYRRADRGWITKVPALPFLTYASTWPDDGFSPRDNPPVHPSELPTSLEGFAGCQGRDIFSIDGTSVPRCVAAWPFR